MRPYAGSGNVLCRGNIALLREDRMLRNLLTVTPLVALAAALCACTTARVYSTTGGLYANDAGRELFLYRYSAPEAGHSRISEAIAARVAL